MTVDVREYPSHLVPRVTHLDAQLLDDDIIDILKSSLLESVQYTGVGSFTKLEPEIDALLKLAVYRYTLVKQNATVGQLMLQIKYPKTTPKSTLKKYSSGLVIITWLHKRIHDIIKYFYGNNAFSGNRFISDLELVYSLCHIVNLLVFLHQGFYGTVAERLFKLRPVPTAPPHTRQISYSYFSRELLWHGFSELLTVVLPLIPAKKLHNLMKSCLPSHKLKSDMHSEDNVVLSRLTTCVVCGNVPVLPHQFGCCHTVCYYCLLDKHSQQHKWQCPRCDHILENKSQISPVQVCL